MTTRTYQRSVNIPSLNDFAAKFPAYGPFASGSGKFLFDLIMSPANYVRAEVAAEDLNLPAVAGVAEVCFQAVQAQAQVPWSGYIKQYIGAVLSVLMEANGFRKTGMKKSIPHPAFTKGEYYKK